jgi:branched-chain amino acid transport system substrate-binding protein
MKDSKLCGSSISRRGDRRWRHGCAAVLGLGAVAMSSGLAKSADAYLPIVMPITGFMSVEGGSQRNGAVMALEHARGGKTVDYPVFDTGTSATGAASALDKALSNGKPIAAAVSVFGTEMAAMMPGGRGLRGQG